MAYAETSLLPLGTLVQSHLLSSRSVDPLWLRSLFRFIEEKPRTAVYSMAFALSFVRTYGLSSDDLNGEETSDSGTTTAAFVGARELFDLLDDNIGNTDTLSATELQRSRVFDATHFARANDAYVDFFNGKILPILKRYRALFVGYNPAASFVDTAAIVATFVQKFRSDEETRDLTANDVLADIREIGDVLTRINARAEFAHEMRIPANPRCSISVSRLDMSWRDELVYRVKSDIHSSTSETSRVPSDLMLREVAELLIRPIVVSDADNADVTLLDRPYTYLEAYEAYAPVLYRYESLREIIARWGDSRLARRRDNHDDEFIRCIVLPARGVWQSGTSQILWIVLHVLAALTVERRNCYIERMLVLLENLSFFVWCAVCSMHWSSNRGDEFFRHVSILPLSTLRKLPIDIVLLRCHNTVHANSGNGGQRGSTLSAWHLANLCIDYRDFASKSLLRRGDRSTAREFRLAVCRPLANALRRIRRNERAVSVDVNGGDDRPLNDDQLLTLALTTTGSVVVVERSQPIDQRSVETSQRDLVLLNALRDHYGGQLMRKLWNDIDPTMNVPICAMW